MTPEVNPTIRFSEEHLQIFSAASLDFNPLHLLDSYARTTPFGERLVYGVLGVVACLKYLEPPQDQHPSAIRVEFRAPLFLGIDYTLRAHRRNDGTASIDLLDGSTLVLHARVRFGDGAPHPVILADSGVAPNHTARLIQTDELTPGLTFAGEYGPPAPAYLKLLEHFGVNRQRTGDVLPLALLCSSYLTGMELPGESAAFVGFELDLLATPATAPFTFEISLDHHDQRFRNLKSRVLLSDGPGPFVKGTTLTVARPARGLERAPIEPLPGLAGKTALVIGASRGLGAALTLQLVASGCTVVGTYARSRDDSDEVLRTAQSLPGSCTMVQGDATDISWCKELSQRLREQPRTLDLLVLSASPALHTLRLEPAFLSRIQSYVQRGLALVSAPLSAFAGIVSESGGSVLLISSIAVETPPPHWAHYVAVKAAAEGLLRSAVLEYPKAAYWIARLNKVQTDLINTPIGRLNAEAPAVVALRILERVSAQHEPGRIQYCR